ncbi:hypothetical protein I7I51_04870 [Histoplasma capsulatum]|uniref:Uncharacterized protein n=1 Tax=Ajellomyces capsulatus TaxID=5037 RepID=A0A8A1M602_AJECA|nr:predicted protein [Histoplasma mississippiense (nom. inval.)]EDN09473.1 predicted protein [Histoplasma mississippiense (nom. inval.)]QSS60074.1 hypothetical protein I7I51_04870 [Histoplasma capsulatum]
MNTTLPPLGPLPWALSLSRPAVARGRNRAPSQPMGSVLVSASPQQRFSPRRYIFMDPFCCPSSVCPPPAAPGLVSFDSDLRTEYDEAGWARTGEVQVSSVYDHRPIDRPPHETRY